MYSENNKCSVTSKIRSEYLPFGLIKSLKLMTNHCPPTLIRLISGLLAWLVTAPQITYNKMLYCNYSSAAAIPVSNVP